MRIWKKIKYNKQGCENVKMNDKKIDYAKKDLWHLRKILVEFYAKFEI